MDLFFNSFKFLLFRPRTSTPKIQDEDLIPTPSDLQAKVLYESFERLWNEKKDNPRGRLPILWHVLHQLIFRQFWYAGVCRLFSDALVLAGPILIEYVVRAAQNSDHFSIFFYSTGLLLTSIFQALFLQQFIDACFLCGAKVTNAATTVVYHNTLKLRLQQIYPPRTLGEINNIQSNDAASLREFVVFAHNLWSCPLTIIGCVGFLLRLLGPIGLISVVILLLFIPLESFVADQSRINKKSVSKLSDYRMGLIYELIDGIKTLKLTGLREFILNRISKGRKNELSVAWKGKLLNTANLVISRLVPVIVIALTFGLYLIYAKSTLDAPTVFATLSLINIMARPISVIPKCVSLLAGCLVSLKRIEDLVRLGDEANENPSSHNEPSLLSFTQESADPCIEFSRVTVLRRSTNDLTSSTTMTTPLQDINCTLHGPALVLVVGDNGSGKTTFLHAILKETPMSNESKISNSIVLNGEIHDNSPRIAYCGHDSWILRDTVRKNIVIGDPSFIHQGIVDEVRYQQAIRACHLEEDMRCWPNGDMTIVGEKGVTISGGQKARVSLARALYSQAPILLLDSPLAGLDREISRKVFFEAIKQTAEKKLVIMTTHRLDLLSHCDKILVLQTGSLIYNGTFEDLKYSENTQNVLTQIQNHHLDSGILEDTLQRSGE